MITIERTMEKMTLEKLAEMVRDGFAAVDERFAQVDRRFESLEAKLDVKINDLRAEMNDRFDQVDEEIRGLHRVDDDLNERLSKLENRRRIA